MDATTKTWIENSPYREGFAAGKSETANLADNPYGSRGSNSWAKMSWAQGYQDARANRPSFLDTK